MNVGHPVAAYIDGHEVPILRPSNNQETYYNGHYRRHCVLFQVVCAHPMGIARDVSMALAGATHDLTMFERSDYMQRIAILKTSSVDPPLPDRLAFEHIQDYHFFGRVRLDKQQFIILHEKLDMPQQMICFGKVAANGDEVKSDPALYI